jgi:polar amino acid transport system substrate-binding protein
MKQVVLEPKTGRVSLEEVPAPSAAPGQLLVRTDVSVVSPGTERQLIQLSSMSAVEKARARPDAARQVVETVLREGLRSAAWKAQARLEHSFSLGYSLAGTVLELGKDVPGPPPGARVACGGAQLAVHAEIVSIPRLLAVLVPEGVSQEQAAFAYVGAIGLHAVRLAEVAPGGTASVVGLGLIGQLIVQLLSASGVHVVGIDPNPERRALASRLSGCDVCGTSGEALEVSRARGGADAVLVAAAGGDPDILEGAIDMARDRARIVVVGSVPISVDRDRMYQKELSLVVARSAGPGRYDRSYEEQGVDMPVGHVRWTEGRNMEAFLGLVRRGRLAVAELVTHRFRIDEVDHAYEMVRSGREPSLGILLQYPQAGGGDQRRDITLSPRAGAPAGRPRIGVIGAGMFARSVLLPRLKRFDVELGEIATATGASALSSAKQFGFVRASTDAGAVLSAPDTQAILVATRHDLHADLAAKALAAGKSVYVEKPLSLDREGIERVCEAWRGAGTVLSVGFNRRFAPLMRRLRAALGNAGSIMATYVVNVPPLAPQSWILDSEQGGGVVLAEGGHFIDLLSFLAGGQPVEVAAIPAGEYSYQASLRFGDGSVASLIYTTQALGHGPKEILTVAGRGVLAQLNDFRSLTLWRTRGRRSFRSKQDKGHEGALRAWVDAIRAGTEQPVDMLEIVAVSEATICLQESLATGAPVTVRLDRYVDALAAAATE